MDHLGSRGDDPRATSRSRSWHEQNSDFMPSSPPTRRPQPPNHTDGNHASVFGPRPDQAPQSPRATGLPICERPERPRESSTNPSARAGAKNKAARGASSGIGQSVLKPAGDRIKRPKSNTVIQRQSGLVWDLGSSTELKPQRVVLPESLLGLSISARSFRRTKAETRRPNTRHGTHPLLEDRTHKRDRHRRRISICPTANPQWKKSATERPNRRARRRIG